MLGICSLSVLLLHETLLVPVSYVWQWEKERSTVMAVQMDNLRGLLGIRRMNRIPNIRIRELCGVTKGVDKRIDEGVFRWFGHVERMEEDSLCRSVCLGLSEKNRFGCQASKENGAG